MRFAMGGARRIVSDKDQRTILKTRLEGFGVVRGEWLCVIGVVWVYKLLIRVFFLV